MSGFCRPGEAKTARKEHRCTFCFYGIVAGERHWEQTGIWEGKAFRNRFHVECWDELCDDNTDDEFTPGSGEPPERLREAETDALRRRKD
jgi:hypothetical protein